MRILALIGFLAIVGAIGAAVFFLGGFYDVGAIAARPAAVDWALARVRAASIARHATDGPPATLDDPATIQAGARAFETRGCVVCHGAPGVPYAKFPEGMNPWPADLNVVAKQSDVAQIFWVVKHGIGMTGMPSFGAEEAPDAELWTIAAFVKKLPTVSEADYKAWTAAK